ncbi:MAG TPA: hypothetical protein VMW16_01475 [Sedimentisphaerales bacterium]|nr:hypothetical protein [Sedimentisphaerales bacterium]
MKMWRDGNKYRGDLGGGKNTKDPCGWLTSLHTTTTGEARLIEI